VLDSFIYTWISTSLIQPLSGATSKQDFVVDDFISAIVSSGTLNSMQLIHVFETFEHPSRP
jgi:hypothetical protein